MTQLAAPAPISQLSEGPLGWNVCGEAECWSILQAFGISVSLTALTQLSIQLGASRNGETVPQVLVNLLGHYGVPASFGAAPLAGVIPAALIKGHRLIVLVSSNSDGDPTPGQSIGHWVGPFGDDSGVYPTLNTLGSPPGQIHDYPQPLLQACDLRMFVEVQKVAPGSAPPPPLEETRMLVVFTATVTAGQYKGVAAQFLADGIHFRWIENQQQLNDIVTATGPAFNRGPVQQWPGGPVADPGAFGTPANQVTASMLGLPFP